MSKNDATYIGRPRQRVIAVALEKAMKEAGLSEEQEDTIVFSMFDSLSENNGTKPMGFGRYLDIDGE